VGVIAGQLAAGGETAIAARASLASMTAPGAGQAIVKLLSTDLPSSVKAELIEVLISRREAGAMDVFMSAAAGSDADVARAAAKAIGVLGGTAELPKLIAMFLAQKDDARRDQLAQAIGSISARDPNSDAPAGMIIDAIAKADPASRPQLVALLARVAGPKALAEARRQLKSTDAEARKAAINAMSAWPTIEPADDLLAIAKADSGAEAILAIRGCASLLGKPGNAKPADAVAKLAEAMGLAKRTEEKRAILAVLPNVACDEAVKLAESLGGDKTIAREANLAAEKTKAAMAKPAKGKGRGKKPK
jgi:hypothetical protein